MKATFQVQGEAGLILREDTSLKSSDPELLTGEGIAFVVAQIQSKVCSSLQEPPIIDIGTFITVA